jgi:hypothetical protein
MFPGAALESITKEAATEAPNNNSMEPVLAGVEAMPTATVKPVSPPTPFKTFMLSQSAPKEMITPRDPEGIVMVLTPSGSLRREDAIGAEVLVATNESTSVTIPRESVRVASTYTLESLLAGIAIQSRKIETL